MSQITRVPDVWQWLLDNHYYDTNCPATPEEIAESLSGVTARDRYDILAVLPPEFREAWVDYLYRHPRPLPPRENPDDPDD